ncbi:MAG: hypothetical protein RLZZ618_55 [Pseudomonadota bacterium]|jgi:Tfp pilus assembly protein PilO
MSDSSSWRLRAQIALHRHGPVPLVVLALLLAGALAWAHALSRHTDQLGQKGMADVAVAVPRSSAPSLPAWTPPAQLNQRVRSLMQLAESQGLELGRVDYRWPDGESEAQASRLELGIPLRADYAAIKRFMAAVLLDSPAISIDQLTLRRDSANPGRMEAMLWLSIWQTGVMNGPATP